MEHFHAYTMIEELVINSAGIFSKRLEAPHNTHDPHNLVSGVQCGCREAVLVNETHGQKAARLLHSRWHGGSQREAKCCPGRCPHSIPLKGSSLCFTPATVPLPKDGP
jgi:hypothetical protein